MEHGFVFLAGRATDEREQSVLASNILLDGIAPMFCQVVFSKRIV